VFGYIRGAFQPLKALLACPTTAAHDPEKPALGLIGDGYSFLGKIMRKLQEVSFP